MGPRAVVHCRPASSMTMAVGRRARQPSGTGELGAATPASHPASRRLCSHSTARRDLPTPVGPIIARHRNGVFDRAANDMRVSRSASRPTKAGGGASASVIVRVHSAAKSERRKGGGSGKVDRATPAPRQASERQPEQDAGDGRRRQFDEVIFPGAGLGREEAHTFSQALQVLESCQHEGDGLPVECPLKNRADDAAGGHRPPKLGGVAASQDALCPVIHQAVPHSSVRHDPLSL